MIYAPLYSGKNSPLQFSANPISFSRFKSLPAGSALAGGSFAWLELWMDFDLPP
jgi:hypothetical protein